MHGSFPPVAKVCRSFTSIELLSHAELWPTISGLHPHKFMGNLGTEMYYVSSLSEVVCFAVVKTLMLFSMYSALQFHY